MKMKKYLTVVIVLFALCCSLAAVNVQGGVQAASGADFTEQYRPQLTYTPSKNWNNDPNGLVYADGVYHMYYQYATTGNAWDTMHWGHATSGDLVHWTEQAIAIYPNMPGWEGYNATVPSGPIFSGSAVYVAAEQADRAYNGTGFYAVFTQPNQTPAQGEGDQRQSIAYSLDGAKYEASTFREIIPNNYDAQEDGGVKARGDFRDPKIFWDDARSKWVMVVGGGEIVQFSSRDLSDWQYDGTTGLWGECPDLFPLTDKEGVEKWVMVLSPEDKPQSHEFNGTDRSTHEYPNEFYIIGSRDERGIFTPDSGETLRPLSIGVDSYAIQTFNSAPDGRRIGVSWAASWKTAGDYANKGGGGLRENWNGGMTMLYELGLIKTQEGYALTKNPVSEYQSLRDQTLKDEKGVQLQQTNFLQDVSGNLAEIDVTLDVSNTTASEVTLKLALSKWEETVIRYDILQNQLVIDRSKSSLAAKDTSRYGVVYSAKLLPTAEGKVRIHAYLDWGNLTVFAGEGQVSATVAIFPSLISSGMELCSDAQVLADVSVYSLNGIHNNEAQRESFDSFYLSAKNETLNVSDSLTVLACSPSSLFDPQLVTYSVTAGDGVVSLDTSNSHPIVTAQKEGQAQITAEYNGKKKSFTVKVYRDSVNSQIGFGLSYAGKWYRAQGYTGSSGGDGFLYSDRSYKNFTLKATVTAAENTQAAGIVFAASDNFYSFYCANYDYKEKSVKLWMSGGETLAQANISLRRGEPIDFGVSVSEGEIVVSVNGSEVLSTYHGLYSEGKIGLNVFNGTASFNNITVATEFGGGESPNVAAGEGNFIIENLTDRTYLTQNHYTVEEGVVTLKPSYLNSLKAGKLYLFSLLRADGSRTEFSWRAPASSFEILEAFKSIGATKPLTVAVNGGGADITKVLIGGKEVPFTLERSRITVQKDVLLKLSDGLHTMTVISSNGAAEYVFEYRFVPPAPIDKTGMILSAVFAAIALAIAMGFVVYWVVSAFLIKKNKEVK